MTGDHRVAYNNIALRDDDHQIYRHVVAHYQCAARVNNLD